MGLPIVVEAGDSVMEGVVQSVGIGDSASGKPRAGGGICVPADLWRQAGGAIPVKCSDLGEHQVKNIADPIHVFALSADASLQ